MKKLIFATTFIIIFLVFVAPAMLALGIRLVPNDFQPPLKNPIELFGKFKISQDFVSTKENLSAMAMSIKNPNLKNKKDITLFLYDKEGELLRTSVLSGRNIGDGAFVKFMFETIADSKNKEYSFVLLAPSAKKEELLGVFYTDNKPLWIGDLRYNEEIVDEKGVAFVTFHKPVSRVGLIKTIYSDWINRLLGDTSFFVFYIITVGFLTVYLLSKSRPFRS